MESKDIERAIQSPKPHAVIVPFPFHGHIVPMMELARLLASKDFIVTVVLSEFTLSRLIQSKGDHSSESDVSFVGIPDNLPQRFRHVQYLTESILASETMVGGFCDMMEKLKSTGRRVSCIISDVLMSWTQIVADKFGIPRAALWTSSTFCFPFIYHVPLLLSEGHLPIKDAEDAFLGIPGLPPIFRGKDMPTLLQAQDFATDRLNDFVIRQMKLLIQADWILANTFEEFEGAALESLRKEFPILPVGPLLNSLDSKVAETIDVKTVASPWPEDNTCLDWLDAQYPCSVLYVSFGSLAVLSARQVEELALGLEASQQPFLWAFRPEYVAGASVRLPDGFISRTSKIGLVVSWTPQLKVLSHSSIGGFLTHCGWNSILESICVGVPMLGWPSFAEQKMNCRLMVVEWMIGMDFREGQDGMVSGEEVERAVRAMMQGEEGKRLRRRVIEWKEKARSAVGEGGRSRCNLNHFLEQLLQKSRIDKGLFEMENVSLVRGDIVEENKP